MNEFIRVCTYIDVDSSSKEAADSNVCDCDKVRVGVNVYVRDNVDVVVIAYESDDGISTDVNEYGSGVVCILLRVYEPSDVDEEVIDNKSGRVGTDIIMDDSNGVDKGVNLYESNELGAVLIAFESEEFATGFKG